VATRTVLINISDKTKVKIFSKIYAIKIILVGVTRKIFSKICAIKIILVSVTRKINFIYKRVNLQQIALNPNLEQFVGVDVVYVYQLHMSGAISNL
jgi:hypothetical protein